jgi:hypothetical protein
VKIFFISIKPLKKLLMIFTKSLSVIVSTEGKK